MGAKCKRPLMEIDHYGNDSSPVAGQENRSPGRVKAAFVSKSGAGRMAPFRPLLSQFSRGRRRLWLF
jgi:hypothetical protein